MFEEISKDQIKNIKTKLGFFKGFCDKFLVFVIFAQYVFYAPILITKDPFIGYYVTRGYVIVGVLLSLLISCERILPGVYCSIAATILSSSISKNLPNAAAAIALW